MKACRLSAGTATVQTVNSGGSPPAIQCGHSRPPFCIARGCELCNWGLTLPSATSRPARRSGNPPPPQVTVVGIGLDDGCRAVLERVLKYAGEMRPCGFFGTATDALKAVPRLNPRLAVVELRLGKWCGIDFARRLLARAAGLAILLVTGTLDAALEERARAAGVADTIAEPLDSRRLEYRLGTALRRSELGRLTAPAQTGGQPSLETEPAGVVCLTSGNRTLNAREEALLECLARGRRYKEIVVDLQISESLVKKIQHSAYHKLGAQNGIEAVLKWQAKIRGARE